ncbi:hypothetical protein ScPMuIL_015938 [Solemya velum]
MGCNVITTHDYPHISDRSSSKNLVCRRRRNRRVSLTPTTGQRDVTPQISTESRYDGPPPDYTATLPQFDNQQNAGGLYPYNQGQYTNVAIVTQPRPVAYVSNGSPPGDYFGFAIFVTICCFVPTGIAAIVLASFARNYMDRGDYENARSRSKAALILCIVSIILGLTTAGVIIYLRDTTTHLRTTPPHYHSSIASKMPAGYTHTTKGNTRMLR